MDVTTLTTTGDNGLLRGVRAALDGAGDALLCVALVQKAGVHLLRGQLEQLGGHACLLHDARRGHRRGPRATPGSSCPAARSPWRRSRRLPVAQATPVMNSLERCLTVTMRRNVNLSAGRALIVIASCLFAACRSPATPPGPSRPSSDSEVEQLRLPAQPLPQQPGMMSLWQPPPGDPRVTVEVLDYGGKDRHLLRQSLVSGTTQNLRVTYQMARVSKRRADNGRLEEARETSPTVVLFLMEEVGPVDADGSATVTLTVGGTATLRVEEQTEAPEALLEGLHPLMTSPIVMHRTPRGLTGRIGVALPSRSNDVMLRPLLRSLLPPMIVLPRDRIGLGARWRATMPNTLEGIPVVTSITYSLDRMSSGMALIDGVVSMQPKGTGAGSRKVAFESRFHLELDMTHAIPLGTVRQRDRFLLEGFDGVVAETWGQSVLTIRPLDD